MKTIGIAALEASILVVIGRTPGINVEIRHLV
jgi:hypothetical protein